MRLLLALLLAAQPLPAAQIGSVGARVVPMPGVSRAAALAPLRLPAPSLAPASSLGAAPKLIAPTLAAPRVAQGLSSDTPLAAAFIHPSLSPIVVPEANPAVNLAQRLAPIAEQVLAESQGLGQLSGEGSSAAGERHIQLLLGETTPEAPSQPLLPGAPKPLSPSETDAERPGKPAVPSLPDAKLKKRNVSMMRAGTAAFKTGMEVVKIGVTCRKNKGTLRT